MTPKEVSMDFNTYQKEALRTDRVPARGGADDTASLIVPMLGLAGETGQLLSEYKKHLRDGEAHCLFKERVSEELGDLLWYIANVASKFELSLSDIAAANLAKVKQRWTTERAEPLTFDAELPEGERLPRRFEVELIDAGEVRQRVRVLIDGKPFGAELTDNA
jgi:NTP pyrophosphatase (non-canonical NTP hydrolase)